MSPSRDPYCGGYQVEDREECWTLEKDLVMEEKYAKSHAPQQARAPKLMRPWEKIFAPMQNVGFGGAATEAILPATGVLTLGTGLILGISARAFTATAFRLRLSTREDAAM